jgi:tRNA threonylcarbamoyladenosine biosynthesis protein TsaB
MSFHKTDTSLIILSVETATRAGSLAVRRGAEVLAQWRGTDDFSHSSELLIVIEDVLRVAEVKLSEIQLFAVALGPGSFTGLRVGLATVKGLCAALQTPAIGVPALEAISFGHQHNQAVCAILPAGRGEVFAQIWSANKSRLLTLKLTDLLAEIKHYSDIKVIAPLDVQKQIEELASETKTLNFSEIPENIAVNVGLAAWRRWQNGEREQNLTIIYGRGADAAKPNKAV